MKSFDVVTFLLAISLGAGWQLTFGPYVADYSRYLPRATSDRTTFWSTFAGSVIGSQWSMTFGALVAAVAGDAFLDDQVGFVGSLAGPALIAVLIYLVIVIGKLTVNCLNAYGGFMSILTTVTAFNGRLFDSSRAPLIERRNLDDEAASRAVLALTTRRSPDRSGRERIAYRDLGVEQLGAVYETLLDYEPSPGSAALRSTARLARKASGSFYTPQPIAQWIVRHTLALL